MGCSIPIVLIRVRRRALKRDLIDIYLLLSVREE
jgi:hypothetical protein